MRSRMLQASVTLAGILIVITGCKNQFAAEDAARAEWNKFISQESGREVWQMTTDSATSVACYFEGQAFTSDEKYIVFSSNRSGIWKLYRASLQSGEIAPLTSDERKISGDDYTVMPDGRQVCYLDGWKMYAADIESGTEQLLFDFTGRLPGAPRFSGSFTNDGIYTVVSVQLDSIRSIYRINLHSEEVLEVHRQYEGSISHPIINPEDPDVITYVPGPDTQNDMSLPMEQRARTWKIDLKEGTDKQFLTMPYGFRATHESWTRDGARFTFFRKTRPGWSPAAICSIDKSGGDFRVHYENDSIKLGHGCADKSSEWFISDCQEPGKNELVLVNLLTGEAKILCYPNSSSEAGHSEFAHVHPSFSSAGNFVIYTSDRTGTPQVYVVPIGDLTGK